MDNTIFDSRKLYEQREKRITANVAVTGNVPAGTLRTYVSEWFNMSIVNSTIRGDIFVPGSLQIPSGSNLTMTVPAFVTYNANFDAFVPYSGQYRIIGTTNTMQDQKYTQILKCKRYNPRTWFVLNESTLNGGDQLAP